MTRSIVRSAISVMAVTGLSLVGAPATAVASVPLEVTVTGGEIAGFATDGIIKYLGIPFAASTGGEARFSAPRPVPSWPGIRPAPQSWTAVPTKRVSTGDATGGSHQRRLSDR